MKKEDGWHQFLSSAVEQSSEGIAIADLEGKLMYVNPAWAHMHGYNAGEELIGRSLEIFHNQKQIEKEVNPFNLIVKEKGNNTGEVGHIRKDGTSFPTLMTTTLLKDDNGKPIAILGISKDITELKQIVETLRDSETKFRCFSDAVFEGIFIHDKGILLEANSQAFEIFGYERDELIGKQIIPLLLTPESIELVKQKVVDDDVSLYEMVGINKLGEEFPIELQSSLGQYKGRQVRFTTFRNITERKQAEKEKEKLESQLRTMIDSCPGWMACLDTDGNYLIANNYYTETFHIPLSQVEGHNFKNFFPPDLYERHKQLIAQSFAIGKSLNWEDQHKFEEDRITYLYGVYTPLYDKAGLLWGVSAFVQDVTNVKQAEKDLKESEEKYRTLIESSREVIFSKDRHGRYHSLNLNAALSLGGTCIEDVAGKTDYDLLPRAQAAALQETDKEVMDGGKTKEAEEVVTDAQGQARIYLFRKWPTYDNEGRISGVGCFATDITERKKAELELEQKTLSLEESNIALKVLMKQREADKKELEKNILFNVKKLVEPSLKKLKKNTSDKNQKIYLEVIESNLNEITSPFTPALSGNLSKLTPAETQIANLIKQGITTKEIASLLNLSPTTVSTQRQKIRKKLGLTNKKMNLQTILASNQQ